MSAIQHQYQYYIVSSPPATCWPQKHDVFEVFVCQLWPWPSPHRCFLLSFYSSNGRWSNIHFHEQLIHLSPSRNTGYVVTCWMYVLFEKTG